MADPARPAMEITEAVTLLSARQVHHQAEASFYAEMAAEENRAEEQAIADALAVILRAVTLSEKIAAAHIAVRKEQDRQFPGIKITHGGRWSDQANALDDLLDELMRESQSLATGGGR